MRIDIHVHHKEAFLLMANAALEAQIQRANAYIADLKAQLSTATASVTTAADAEDTAVAGELSSVLDAAGAPAAA